MVYIHKIPVEVKAKMVTMMGLSGHADSYELLHWLEPWKNHPKKVFINHGEPLRSEAKWSLPSGDHSGWKMASPRPPATTRVAPGMPR